ncbi:MAG: metallophosphoesterase [Gemmataceae bacterium]|nr:metallophosphoesterase [Gemmataceae bacterium]
MRTLAIGDIHGCLTALDLLLEQVQPQPDDLIVTLGDYVDRGPDSKGVLDRLLALRPRCRMVTLKGNHDLMMLAARDDLEHFHDWLSCGGKQTLESYRVESHRVESYRSGVDWETFAPSIPERHWRFLEEDCVPYYESDTHFFVHANADTDVPLAEQPDYMLYWERLRFGRRIAVAPPTHEQLRTKYVKLQEDLSRRLSAAQLKQRADELEKELAAAKEREQRLARERAPRRNWKGRKPSW